MERAQRPSASARDDQDTCCPPPSAWLGGGLGQQPPPSQAESGPGAEVLEVNRSSSALRGMQTRRRSGPHADLLQVWTSSQRPGQNATGSNNSQSSSVVQACGRRFLPRSTKAMTWNAGTLVFR